MEKRQTNGHKNRTPATAVGVGNDAFKQATLSTSELIVYTVLCFDQMCC